jgi:hypothetical protein
MPSTYNPSGSNSNCFFVTTAYLLGLPSVNDLPTPLRDEMNTGEGEFPMDFAIHHLLSMTGHPYRTQAQCRGETEPAQPPSEPPVQDFEILSQGNGAVWRWEQFLMSKWCCSKIGIGYATPEDVLHFIVLTDAHPPTYMCYQHSTAGVDKWLQVRGDWRALVSEAKAKVVYAFGFVGERYDDSVDGQVPSYGG